MPPTPQPRFKSKRTLKPQPVPPGLYASTYDVALGAAICRRIAAGESLRSICRAEASMPTEKTVWNWARHHPEFKAMKDHAFATARARSLAAREDVELGKLIRFGGERGRTGRPCGYDEAVAQAILERLVVGEALTAICRDPAMPSVGTVYNWLRKYPAFLDRYRKMKRGLADTMAELACADLPILRRERDDEVLIRRTVRRAERAAALVSLKRYAPCDRADGVVVTVRDSDGRPRVLYDGPPLRGGEPVDVSKLREI